MTNFTFYSRNDQIYATSIQSLVGGVSAPDEVGWGGVSCPGLGGVGGVVWVF